MDVQKNKNSIHPTRAPHHFPHQTAGKLPDWGFNMYWVKDGNLIIRMQ
jgi:hypothetical protein